MIGRVLRWPLRFIPREAPRRILTGAGAGLVWYPASGPHGIWLGLYERSCLRAFALAAREQGVIWDVGAHAGIYSLVAARRKARVFAFEPVPENVSWIARNLEANGLTSYVTVRRCALGAYSGSSGFEREASRMEGCLSRTAAATVAVCKADEADLPLPCIIKIDVEGAEIDVLAGAALSIRRSRPLIFLETHEPVTIQSCLQVLSGYRAERLESNRYLCRP